MGQMQLTLWPQPGSQTTLVTDEELIMSQAEVKNWNFMYFLQVHSMEGHNGGVTGVQLQMNLAATSSYDATVRKLTQESWFGRPVWTWVDIVSYPTDGGI